MSASPVVIVGGGQAGGRVAEALRLGGHTGRVTLIGTEVHPPYERPVLSKGFLTDARPEDIAWVRPSDWYATNDIEFLCGRTALHIDRDQQRLELDDGRRLPYGSLVLTTGTRPRALPVQGANHPHVSYLRTIEDSRRIQQMMAPGARIGVIGAGFIGMEVAAAAVTRGCKVTVLEAADLPMKRGLPPLLGLFYAALHRSQGVDLRTSAVVSRILENGVELHSAEVLPADLVVIGVGVVPNVELAEAAELECNDGIVVDQFGRTRDPQIYAAGDVTNHFNPLLGRHVRLESWQNAQNQAIAVARNLCGNPTPYAEVPWFWSDQFDINLQIAGVALPGDTVIQRGSPGDGPVTFFHVRQGRLAAAVGINSARDVRIGKELIALGAPVDASGLGDHSLTLAAILRNAKKSLEAA